MNSTIIPQEKLTTLKELVSRVENINSNTTRFIKLKQAYQNRINELIKTI